MNELSVIQYSIINLPERSHARALHIWWHAFTEGCVLLFQLLRMHINLAICIFPLLFFFWLGVYLCVRVCVCLWKQTSYIVLQFMCKLRKNQTPRPTKNDEESVLLSYGIVKTSIMALSSIDHVCEYEMRKYRSTPTISMWFMLFLLYECETAWTAVAFTNK